RGGACRRSGTTRRNGCGMTDTKDPGEKTLSVAPTKRLTLKRPVEQNVVRQSFSHGRSKAVVVEKVKRRTLGPSEAAPVREPAPPAAAPPPPAPAPRAASPTPQPVPRPFVPSGSRPAPIV